MLAVARIGRPVGVTGMVRVTTFSQEYDHLRRLTVVELRSGEVRRVGRIDRCTVRDADALIGFVGVTSPEEARTLTGWEIWTEREQASPLGSQEHYVADLVGCTVVCEDVAVGIVGAVVDGGQAPLLEVLIGGTSSDSGARRLVPFMDRFVGTVAPDRRTIELRERWVIE